MLDCDSNYVKGCPMKSRETDEMIRCYNECYTYYKNAGFTARLLRLDNEVSKDHEKLRKIIDYDILPELELRLHTLIKDINQCMDDLIKIKDEIPDDPEEKKVIENVEGNDERDLVQRIDEIQAETK